ncbi:LLM class flavin-dependent oxidoreductase [Staphylococcus condimenti]|uniref:LLM class flavin-dependent oxidoreductase n=1 Tax=Staphylococcus condimenti TaxID=70255 RepID=A0A143PD16_9STAP|nr:MULTISPECIES: LLM class flavin-dependent oxidoreductase [Staphylococcus]AMY06462.1 luciferase [Staphylococcus condimenti]MDK8644193.1 LLM class flavin-dependent oxidoreductase [Staphylococcus condimenti]OFP00747.1 luciferase [Staphylococcus sp. HMSC065E08]PNZ58197.1 LLM class flavin-dependent oxidoreductase [Staphylococcus condimenti]QQS81731.1 LLM class flavin-dependent oxidoreductase [Staphylococcus condimenti]
MKIEIGMTSFADTNDIHTESGVEEKLSADKRIRHIVEEITLADEVGLDVYGLGEHHRSDYAVSDPVTVLAAAASLTQRIKLSSAVTVLSSDDPVRVYERFATLDAVSNGRAEIMVGRGSFIESFPLFGYNLDDYDRLFVEKLELLKEINQHEVVTWEGTLRPAIKGLGVYPRAVQEEIPIWLATGGTPESSIRAAEYGLPITYAIIGGNPKRFKRNIAIYRAVAESRGYNLTDMPVAVHSWGYIADTDEQAQREFYEPTKVHHEIIAKERNWPPYTKAHFQREISDEGAMFVGSPETVAQKMIKVIEELEINRFMLHMPVGSMPHERIMKAIKLYGKRVKPIIEDYFNN